MRLYCKDFDEKKCKYYYSPCGVDSFCSLREMDKSMKKWLHNSIHQSPICGKMIKGIDYITKFEYLMKKTLEDNK